MGKGSYSLSDACQETKWALYSQTVAGVQLASGNQCEQCWTLWQHAFRHQSWEALLSQVAKDPAYKSMAEEARKAMLDGKSAKSFPDQSVFTVQGLSVEVERCYIIMTERDLRRASGLGRIGRTQLKGLQSVQLPMEDGQQGQETCYLFADEANPQRRMRIKVQMGSKLEAQNMRPAEVFWEGQGGCYHAHYSQQTAKQSGLLDVISKEQAGHLNITSFETFAQDVLGVKIGGHDQEEQQLAPDPADVGQPACAMVGVAAAGVAAAQSTSSKSTWPGTPPGVRKTAAGASLLRTPSSMSLGSVSQETPPAAPPAPAALLETEECSTGMDTEKAVQESATSIGGDSEPMPGEQLWDQLVWWGLCTKQKSWLFNNLCPTKKNLRQDGALGVTLTFPALQVMMT